MTVFDSNPSMKRVDIWAMLALALLAVISRGYGLWEWAIFQDEHITIDKAHERFQTLVNPAFYFLVEMSSRLFGASEFSIRFPSFLLGACSIPVFFLTWRNVVGRNAALIGSILLIFSAWHLWHAQYARYYAGVFLFASLGYYFYYRAVRQGSIASLAWSLVCAALAFFFHVSAIMVLAGCAIFSFVILVTKNRSGGEYSTRIATIHFVICLIGGLASLPLLWGVAENWYMSDQTWGTSPLFLSLKIIRDVQIPIAIAAFAGLFVLYQRDRLLAIFLAISVCVPVVVVIAGSAVTSIRTDYIFYVYPLLFVLAGAFCDRARHAFPQNFIAANAVSLLLIATLLPDFVSHYTDKKSLDVRDVVTYVKKRYHQDDKVLSFGGEFRYYFSKQLPAEPDLGQRLDPQTDWDEILDDYKNSGHRLWIVVKAGRSPLAKGLERWLLKNSRLVWRKYATRYDADVKGYEVYLVNDDIQSVKPIDDIGE